MQPSPNTNDDKTPDEPRSVVERLLARAEMLVAEGEYDAAIVTAAGAVALVEDDPKHPHAGACHRTLATAHHAAGNLERAALHADRCLEAHASIRGADYAVALHVRALAYLEEGSLKVAMPLLEEAAAIFETLPEHHYALGAVLSTMAEICLETGDSETALALYQRVLADVEATAPESEQHASLMNAVTGQAFLGLGSAYAQRDERDKAKDYLARAVEFFEAAHGLGHPELHAMVEQIAAIYRAIGEEEAALAVEMEKGALELNEVDDLDEDDDLDRPLDDDDDV